MAWKSLEAWVRDLEIRDELLRITEPVAVELEAGAIADRLVKNKAKAVLFGCTLWGGMIHEIKAQVDALCLDPIITAVHFAEFQASLRL